MSDAPLLSNNLVFARTKFTFFCVSSIQPAKKSHSAQLESTVDRTSRSVSPKAVGR
jgi:hypothetical protein